MKYYAIDDDGQLLTAENEFALSRFYKNVLPLPSDYKPNKYIVANGELQANPNYLEELIKTKKELLTVQNLKLANSAIENGSVSYKDCLFETNSQTKANLSGALLLIQSGAIENIDWLSKDDKHISLNENDICQILKLISNYLTIIWTEKYADIKTRIDEAISLDAINEIVIEY